MHSFNAIDNDRYGLHTNCIDRDTLIFLYVINVMKELQSRCLLIVGQQYRSH